ncbi:MAG: chemotaxis protein CheW [Campylobacterales bacterium]|nr:chemotaxis protein CheW [Campylobacterales bacterium]
MQENLNNIENVDVMTFVLGNELYGIEVTKVREILTYQGTTKLPNTKDWVKGVINIRGEVTPIIDLRIKFKTSSIDNVIYNDDTVVIAAKTQDGRMAGIVVDKLEGIESVNAKVSMQVPEISNINREFVKNLFKQNGRMLILMDVERLLSKDEF